MNKLLTKIEINKIRNKCFEDPAKMCAVAQEIADTVQLTSISTYAELKGKHRNTVLQQKDKLAGVRIDGRKYISFIQ